MWLEVAHPANQLPKRTIKKKSPQTFAHLMNFSKNVSAMNHAIWLFLLQNKQTLPMFSLRDLRFVLCSLDLDLLWCAKDHGLFILITHKSTRSENPITWLLTALKVASLWKIEFWGCSWDCDRSYYLAVKLGHWHISLSSICPCSYYTPYFLSGHRKMFRNWNTV